jgi:hypothetical protein
VQELVGADRRIRKQRHLRILIFTIADLVRRRKSFWFVVNANTVLISVFTHWCC